MTDNEDLRRALVETDARIVATMTRIAELERALGAVHVAGGNPATADEALRSAHHLLGLYEARRDILRRKLDAQAP